VPQLSRVTALLAIVAGTAWVAACLALASLPTGCVDEECAVTPQRDWSPTATGLVVLALAMMLASAAGIVRLALRERADLARLGRVAAVTGGLGTVVLGAGVLLAGLGVPWMEDAMPGFVLPGAVLLVGAAGVTVWLVMRSRVLPVWLVVCLAVAVALLVFVNEQTDSVPLGIPFGLAWALLGVLLVRGVRGSTSD
jgi:hypothetical protein